MPHHYQRSIWACCFSCFISHSLLLLEPELIGQWSISGINGRDSMRFWAEQEKSSMRKSRETLGDAVKFSMTLETREAIGNVPDWRCSSRFRLKWSKEAKKRRRRRLTKEKYREQKNVNAKKKCSAARKYNGEFAYARLRISKRERERSAVHIMKCMAKWIHYKIICSDEKREVL